jgi:hypothetical protein
MFSLWNRSMIYSKIHTNLRCFGSLFTLKSAWAPTHNWLHIFCSDIYGNFSFVGALITVVCGPTWTNQWKVCCHSPVMQVWTIKYGSINTSRKQLPDQRTRRWPTFVHPNSTPPRPHLLFTQNITYVYTCINVLHNRADARAQWSDLTTRVTITLAGLPMSIGSPGLPLPTAYIYSLSIKSPCLYITVESPRHQICKPTSDHFLCNRTDLA